MTDWASGYVKETAYTFGYYQELNPLRARIGLLNSGFHAPMFGTACELGFGQGLSTNFHAAASSTEWYGTDFIPTQANFAQELARVSGSGAQLFDQSFEEFCMRKDLPDFNFIALHGIWSWISHENRQLITNFVRRKLKVGGVLYVSYNTFPGWATFAPMRHLMTQHAEVIGSQGAGIINNVSCAVEFATSLMNVQPQYLRANPLVADRLKEMKDKDSHYLAHEYFNKDWEPMHFATLTEWLESAKLNFTGSAHLLDHFDSINMTSDQQEFMKQIPETKLRESVRDFMVNQQFRRDYWVKGPRRISPLERYEALLENRFVLQKRREDLELKLEGGQGKIELSEAIYSPVLDALAGSKVVSIQELVNSLKPKNIQFDHIVETLMILAGMGIVAPAQDDKSIEDNRVKTDLTNDYLVKRARSSKEVSFLVSPVTGGGIHADRFAQLFIECAKQRIEEPQKIALATWEVLKLQGQKMVVEGKTLDSEQENIIALTKLSKLFVDNQLPIYKKLDIV